MDRMFGFGMLLVIVLGLLTIATATTGADIGGADKDNRNDSSSYLGGEDPFDFGIWGAHVSREGDEENQEDEGGNNPPIDISTVLNVTKSIELFNAISNFFSQRDIMGFDRGAAGALEIPLAECSEANNIDTFEYAVVTIPPWGNDTEKQGVVPLFPLGTLSSLFTVMTLSQGLKESGIEKSLLQLARDKGLENNEIVERFGKDTEAVMENLTGENVLDYRSSLGGTMFDLFEDVKHVDGSDYSTHLETRLKNIHWPKAVMKKVPDPWNVPTAYSEHAIAFLAWLAFSDKNFFATRRAMLRDFGMTQTSFYTVANMSRVPLGQFRDGNTLTDVSKHVMGTLLPANDMLATVGDMTQFAATMACSGAYKTDSNGQENDWSNVIMKSTTPRWIPQKGSVEGSWVSRGMRQLLVNGVEWVVADGDWPGWSCRLAIRYPKGGIGTAYAFFIVYSAKDSKPRDAFMQYISTFWGLTTASGTSTVWNSRSSRVPESKSWKGHFVPWRIEDGWYFSPWLTHLEITSLKITSGEDMSFADKREESTHFVERYGNIAVAKVPTSVPIWLGAYPSRKQNDFLVFGDSSLRKVSGINMPAVTNALLPILFIGGLACVITLIVLSKGGWRDKAALRAEQKRSLRAREEAMRSAANGEVNTTAGQGLAGFGLSGAFGDPEEEKPEVPVVQVRGPLDNVLVHTLLIIFTGSSLVCEAIAFIVSVALANLKDLDYGVSAFSVCGHVPKGAWACLVFMLLATLSTACAIALVIYQIIFFRHQTSLLWFILSSLVTVITLALLVWGGCFALYKPLPSLGLDCGD